MRPGMINIRLNLVAMQKGRLVDLGDLLVELRVKLVPFLMLTVEPRALCMLGKLCPTESHPSPCVCFLRINLNEPETVCRSHEAGSPALWAQLQELMWC
jgi:hypothetical protein